MGIEEEIAALSRSLKDETDIGKGISELFKDAKTKKDKDLEHHDVDIRTRLAYPEVSAMSLTNYFATINFKGMRPSIDIRKVKLKGNAGRSHSLGTGLNTLMHNIKRHKISYDGKSRKEIIEILQSKVEAAGAGFKGLFGMGQR